MCRRLLTFVALLALLSVSIPVRAQDVSPVPVAVRQVLELAKGQMLALSPDGTQLAAQRRTEEGLDVCLLATATLLEIRCTAVSGRSVAADSVAWSPDGTLMTFTEDAFVVAEDSDIWVLNTETGALTNLTDDGYAGSRFQQPSEAPLDFVPAFSPDGTALVFARSVQTGDETVTTLSIVPVAGGEPRTLLTVAPKQRAFVAGVRWLEGNTILYSVTVPKTDADTGLWTVSASGGTPRQLMRADATGLEELVLVDVSARGQALLLAYDQDSVAFVLVDLETGQAEMVEPMTGGVNPRAVAFSVDGTRLLLSDGIEDLAIRDLATGADRALAEPDRVEGRDLKGRIGVPAARNGLTWAANDLIFGPGPASSGVLLRLRND